MFGAAGAIPNLGDVERVFGRSQDWPPALRAAVTMVASSPAPAWLWWGPEEITIPNEACAALCTGRAVSGLPAAGLDGEPWATVRAWRARDGAPGECLRIVLDRGDGPTETFFTCTTLRAAAPDGTADGLVVTLIEVTAQVLERRRFETLYQLARATATGPTVDAVCQAAAAALVADRTDLPFVLIYRVDELAGLARRAGAAGLTAASASAPDAIALTGLATGWPLARIHDTGQGEILTQLDLVGVQPGPEAPRWGVALPVRVEGRVAAFLCTGISALRRLDADLRSFLDLAIGELSTAIANSRVRHGQAGLAEKLGELDRKKTDFFVGVTHEFRTPLTLLLASIEDALIEARDPMLRDRMRMAHRNAQRMHKLVNSLLDFARIEANQVRASYAPTDLARLTADVACSFQTVCDQVGLKLVIDCPPQSEAVYVDPQMWEKIVLNLISNAFKFTFFGSIEVALRERVDFVELTVSDSGVGISADHVPHVFDRFYRIEGTRARTAEGTGIGLATVRELVRWHGGDAAVTSTPGSGSQFRVTIRKGTDHLPVAQIDGSHFLISRATRSAFTEEAAQWVVDDLADRVPAGPIGVRPRILWADDNADMRAYVRTLLATEFEVVAVADGRAALDAIRTKSFDLVLADVMMPGLDGLALVQALRAEPRDRKVPILLLSGRSGEDALVAALEGGADEYLVKPLTPRRLIASVRSHLELARLRGAGDPPVS